MRISDWSSDVCSSDLPRRLSGLQELFTGGEALSVDHVRRMRGAAPGVALHNGYGPTECTPFTCTHRIDDVPAGATTIPIGRPIADTSVYILNSRGDPVPTGVVGALHCGGGGRTEEGWGGGGGVVKCRTWGGP